VAIESQIARLAANRATSDDIRSLHTLIGEMRTATDSGAFSSADLNFHLTIARAAGNETLFRVLTAIQSLLRQWIARALASSPSTSEVALQQHIAIVEAIEQRDGEKARLAMEHHLMAMGRIVMEQGPPGSIG
jgi:DNA-binding FadR family transcriptional regulator